MVSRMLRAAFERRMGRRADRLARRLARHLPAGAVLLDIGSGTGHNARALRSAIGATCLEADVVDFHIVGPGPSCFDGRRLPMPDGAVAISLMIHTLSYAEDPTALLREAARVATRGVVLVQSTYRGPLGFLLILTRGWVQGPASFRACRALGLIPSVADPLRSRTLFSRRRLDAVAAEAGLVAALVEPEPGFAGLTSRDLIVLVRPGA